MPSHSNRAEAIGAVSAAVGLLVAFLPWYTYPAGNAHVTVNAFRASPLGDLFYIAIAAVIPLLLIGRLVDDLVTPYLPESTAHAAAAALAMGSVLIQLIVARSTGRSLGHRDLPRALAAAPDFAPHRSSDVCIQIAAGSFATARPASPRLPHNPAICVRGVVAPPFSFDATSAHSILGGPPDLWPTS